jgi:RNA polymerase sigma-70 factor (ECF subfamily)
VITLAVVATPLSQAGAKLAASAEPRLARLIEAQFGFVWRLLRRIGVARADADDAAQQVFIAASRRLPDVRVGSERAFLFSTALHVGARTRRRREDFAVDLNEQPAVAPSREPLPDRHRACRMLDALLEEMPLELRVVFVLYEIEQLGSAEIAEVVGVPPGTVASRLRTAREDFSARVKGLEARSEFGGQGDE